MFALSQTMYLFKANLNLLADTSTPRTVPLRVGLHCQLPLLLVQWSYQERNTHTILYNYGDAHQQMHGEPSLPLLHSQVEQHF